MNQLFQEELLKDETVLWTGQPEPKVLFTKADIFLIPFSLLWAGFAIFWEVTATVMLVTSEVSRGKSPIFFPIFGGFFVLMGLYFVFGRFIYKFYRKKNTYYAVTNKRVLTLTTLHSRNIKAVYIDAITGINKSVRPDGIGSITFGTPTPRSQGYGNTGMDFFTSFYGGDVPIFYDIKDAKKVYELVNDLRKK